ncbi:MAG TPA: glycoside hydrolase family 38 C-terminal domain-containing protein [Gaiellales bacterium]|nr:glycoside hydrolase family 38 C-terminal domain-containing protein [Gaiellales bacterium]
MIRHTGYTRERLAQMSDRLRAAIYPESRAADEVLVSEPVERISWDEAQALDYRPAELGERFGPLWQTFWFRVRATVPEEWRGRRVDLLFVSHSEAALWRDGKIVQGLNTGGDGERPDAVLAEAAEPGPLELQIELACNGMFGAKDEPAELRRCDIAVFDPEAWELFFDFETLRALEAETRDESWSGLLLAELNRYCNEQDPAILTGLYRHHNATHAHELAAIGHAHIDTAWLWPLAETYRKTLRSFSSQLRYMEDYPEYRFACSQAQQYAWIKQRNPDLWRRVRAAVERGQFVPVGGSWVEPDCNLTSGESLVRQFLHGQRWFEAEFGRRHREFWSPDAFGYAGQLPQILREAGITRFLTQKLSWNRFNRPEHHTMTWRGDDGSEVLAHYPPADTYNSVVSAPELLKVARSYRDHDHARTSLLVFGYGDGGGGPTRDMLETLRRAADLQGLPRTTQRTSEEFFDALEADGGDRPVVTGELYFEYHRGVYTSQARTKRGHRRGEQALHDAEFLSCLRADYPRAELDRLWKLLLLQQFHDILPGSSIRLVYEDAERDLAAVEAGADALSGAGETPANTVGFARREVVGDVVYAAAPFGAARIVEADDEVRIDGLTLENAHLRVTLSPDGSVESVLHKGSGRESLAGRGNVLELAEDRPVAFDAWDIDPSALETRREYAPATSWSARCTPLRAEITFERPSLTQVVRLDAGARRVEFRTTVDWREEHTLLTVCFPLAVHARNATYEMPFGYAERPTHWSTSWDRARYEVPGHRWADLSEHGFGVALLNDCKYGWSCLGNELRLSLLRSPRSPDPEADVGRHEFAYALMPHAGGWREAGVVAEAVCFNAPLRLTSAPPPASFASVDDPNLVLDTIKRAEDSDALVLRLYEAHGARGRARVRVAAPFSSARRANVLEDDGERLEVEGDSVLLAYRPHEIVTLKLS